MRYLIDTCLFVSIIEGRQVSDDVEYILCDYENLIYVSSESIKEITHLFQNGKIQFQKGKKPTDFEIFDFVENKLNMVVKYVAKEHLQTMAKLPVVSDHNDPSDRLIISQAITENMPLISSDSKFPKYQKYGLNLIKL